MYELILASGSSRRHSLIDQLNLKYCVCVSNINEHVREGELPEEYVSRMACEKAVAVSRAITLEDSRHVDKVSSMLHVILAADTIVTLNGEILGKPKDFQAAKRCLQKLSSEEHEVLTALYFKKQNDDHQVLVRTKVKFRSLSDEEIEAYCQSEEPYDKAGAYAIQGYAASFVEYISGSYTNVVGLPLLAVHKLIKHSDLLLDSQL